MKKLYVLVSAMLILASQSIAAKKLFIENQGQIKDQSGKPRPDIDFKIEAEDGLQVFIANGAMHYQWYKKDGKKILMYRVDAMLMGANRDGGYVVEQPDYYNENHYVSGAPEKGWLARSFKKITYKNIYDNIDWVFYFNEDGLLEHDFVIRPGGKPSDIRIGYSGATGISIGTSGALVVSAPLGHFSENAPYCYQKEDGEKIGAAFKVTGQQVSFALDKYVGTLVIDPSIQWATYFGGTLRDYATAITTDLKGNLITTGNTASIANIATTGSHQFTFGGGMGSASFKGDAFIAKHDRNGSLLWATYCGGTNDDGGTAVRTDSMGNIYLTGWTKSVDGIATTGSHQPSFGGADDAFLAKFDSSGIRSWSTYYGGTGVENTITIGGIHVDSSGSAYLIGTTKSTNNIATPGSHQPTYGGGASDAFIAKFSPNGIRLWGTYFGGSTNNLATTGTSISGAGNGIYITGNTTSATGVATATAHQNTYGGGTNDAFLARMDTSGSLAWGTYFGGSLDDRATAIVVAKDRVVISGNTKSTNSISTANAFQQLFAGNQDVFVAQFDLTGNLDWATYFGGTALDASALSITADPLGDIYFAGGTTSPSISTPTAFQSVSSGGQDAFVGKISRTGVLMWSSYFGGTAGDNALGIATNRAGMAYICGSTLSATNIASATAVQTSIGGDMDGFIVAINDCTAPQKADTITGLLAVCSGQLTGYEVAPVAGAISYTWILPNGWSGNTTSNRIALVVGRNSGMVRVVANGMCSSSDTTNLSVVVSPIPVITPNSPVFCAGYSIALSVPSSYNSYRWLYNGGLLPGQLSSTLVTALPGTYAVITNNGTCTDTSATVNAVMHPMPLTPAITRSGNLLSTTLGFAHYQWYYNGLPITGSTSHDYLFTVDGSYTVTVTDTNGCRATSAPFQTNPNKVVTYTPARFAVSPNPLTGTTIILVSDFVGEAKLFAMDGRIVKVFSVHKGKQEIDLQQMPSGTYMLLVVDTTSGFATNEKLVIQ